MTLIEKMFNFHVRLPYRRKSIRISQTVGLAAAIFRGRLKCVCDLKQKKLDLYSISLLIQALGPIVFV